MKVFVTRTPPAVDSVTVVPAHAPNASLPDDGALLTYASACCEPPTHTVAGVDGDVSHASVSSVTL